MRILLTGASGFTGKHFQQTASLAGHEVVPLMADLKDGAAIQQAVKSAGGCDAVVHLAAISFVGHSNAAEFYAVNAVGTTNLLSVLADLPPPARPAKVLVASSANVYGNCESSPINESHAPAPVNHYAASKLAMEHMALTFEDRLPVTIVRPFNYTGQGQALSFLIPKIVDHFVRGKPVIELGNLHVEREFNDVRMVCDAYLRLLQQGENGTTYNVCTGTTYTLQSVLAAMAELTGQCPEVKVNPAFVRSNEVHRLCGDPARLAARIGEPKNYTLKDTLSEMLAHALDGSAGITT
jgi:nucleoside-diphosphate-sugar epimerase